MRAAAPAASTDTSTDTVPVTAIAVRRQLGGEAKPPGAESMKTPRLPSKEHARKAGWR